MKMQKVEEARSLIAIFQTSQQVGPESWEIYNVAKEFPLTASLNDVAEWFGRKNPNALRINSIQLHQPEESK